MKGESNANEEGSEETGEKAAKKAVKKGEAYKCTVCGLVVSVDETCGCVDTCDIICCELPMSQEKTGSGLMVFFRILAHR